MDASRSLVRTATSALIAAATAIIILAASILPLLTPAWVGFEQGRSQVTALTGYSEAEVQTITNAILGDLVLGRGDFLVTTGGPEPNLVLTDVERSHMRDVRGVFGGFGLLALAGLSILAVAVARTRRLDPARARAWAAVRRGARGLAVGVVVAGVIALVAFDAAFEVFHRLFFAPGTFEFDPRTSRLVQLFPDQFWSETTIALAGLIFVAALTVAWIAGRRLAADGRSKATSPADGELREPRQSTVGGAAR